MTYPTGPSRYDLETNLKAARGRQIAASTLLDLVNADFRPKNPKLLKAVSEAGFGATQTPETLRSAADKVRNSSYAQLTPLIAAIDIEALEPDEVFGPACVLKISKTLDLLETISKAHNPTAALQALKAKLDTPVRREEHSSQVSYVRAQRTRSLLNTQLKPLFDAPDSRRGHRQIGKILNSTDGPVVHLAPIGNSIALSRANHTIRKAIADELTDAAEGNRQSWQTVVKGWPEFVAALGAANESSDEIAEIAIARETGLEVKLAAADLARMDRNNIAVAAEIDF